ncbi:MAG: hypothetical protein IH919_07750 [Deltaproteobacteria bacterium]|nr:hypothetical protein [Deltaproteobacteria bacterium]
MRYVKLVMVLCASALLVSCSSISKEAKAKLAKPVNCETAKKDMAMLEKEKASVARQAAAGVTSILPVGAALALVTGDTKSRAKVATGAYNRQIDEKIAEIKKTCGLE